MNTFIVVIAIGLLLGMSFMMIRYARFIHRYPGEVKKKIDQETQEKENTPSEDTTDP